MANKRSSGRKDANSDELDAYAEKNGIGIIKCSQFAALGFDRIYLHSGIAYLVEIKNPARNWELTGTEAERLLQCREYGVELNVIEYPIQLAAMVGIEYKDETI